ncbi:hypothetical protein [Sporomusa acidovorans]|uniref:Tail terminator n=1 Tax=Sporomusa acidovorans (strain ATCC 49682 / DSM 3132 / Mol) TaxID=1123286 RepID=A0ABZ3J8Z0_SPOA4|nr:hypothetical protein [Sporomusa acidovorans]OZC16015.1 hypothetical protein SPACI_43810 [Sporomusa acidovorans DSM 3132]SDD89654.1 hypothetical protein SAMN04488499_1005116 [Sporomusa acidovorans]
MSTPLILVDELCRLITDATGELILEAKTGPSRPPSVIPGFLDDDEPKPGKPPEEKAVPFVLVRFRSGEDTEQAGMATVRLIATTYSKHGQGWRDPMNVLERIRQAILTHRPLVRQFDLQLPIKWDMPEEQPWPYWIAWMTTSWTIGRPILTEMEDTMYGENIYYR